MSSRDLLELAELYALYAQYRQRSSRRFGIHPIHKKRKEHGQYHSLYADLVRDEAEFRKYARMSKSAFGALLDLLRSRLVKRSAREPPTKRPRGLRAPGSYRTDELVEEVRKNRVLWNRAARGFHSRAARDAAFKRVASAMNRRFPELRPWCEEEVERHWRLLVQYEFACLTEHGASGKPHSFTCRFAQMSFLKADLLASSNYDSFAFRIYYRKH